VPASRQHDRGANIADGKARAGRVRRQARSGNTAL
jgi:hypothetical protein